MTQPLDPDDLIERLGLAPHPEGGWWCQTWRDGGHDLAGRGVGSSIVYLLGAGEQGRWHRVRDAAEVWHHHAGGPLRLRLAPGEAGPVEEHVLGTDVAAGERPQVVVPPGWWQAADAPSGAALVGCTVAPAFVDEVFELADPGWEPGSLKSGR